MQAGDADVRVEYRGGAEERFGQGLERAMKFGDFVGELERKNDLLYLTTQVRGGRRQQDGGERKRRREQRDTTAKATATWRGGRRAETQEGRKGQ